MLSGAFREEMLDSNLVFERDRKLAQALAEAFDLLLDRDFEFELTLALAFDEAFGFDLEFGSERHVRPPALKDAA